MSVPRDQRNRDCNPADYAQLGCIANPHALYSHCVMVPRAVWQIRHTYCQRELLTRSTPSTGVKRLGSPNEVPGVCSAHPTCAHISGGAVRAATAVTGMHALLPVLILMPPPPVPSFSCVPSGPIITGEPPPFASIASCLSRAEMAARSPPGCTGSNWSGGPQPAG